MPLFLTYEERLTIAVGPKEGKKFKAIDIDITRIGQLLPRKSKSI